MFSVYEIMKSTINSGGYKLAEVQGRIKRMFLYGDLDDAQMEELLELAAGSASADAERPENLELIQTLADRIAALEARVVALESGSGGGEGDVETPEYPEWKPWDGISKDYEQGAVVSYNGELWESVFAGQNVWTPGVGNGLWEKYDPEADKVIVEG